MIAQRVIDYFETSDPLQPDEKLLKRMKKAELIELIKIMAERWKGDTEDKQ